MLSCSKGSRGLSVPLRVIGIFTDTTISPSSRLRQCPDHYTIRAGRNLPDKEFRYLRVDYSYGRRLPGLQFKASLAMTSPLNLPAPGGCQAVCFIIKLRTALCFVKQLPGYILCALPYRRDTYPEVTGSICPSSLTVNHSSLGIFYPTTCVGLRYEPCYDMLSGFSWEYVSIRCPLARGSRYCPDSQVLGFAWRT